MTKNEWIEIGYDKGIIDLEENECVSFKDAYCEWFVMRMRFVREQTMDRIECTYNRYFANDEIIDMCISKITDVDIIRFVMKQIVEWKKITYKEVGRIMQIFTGTCNYMRDIGKGGCPLHDWEKIKRNLPLDALESGIKKEMAIPCRDVNIVMNRVIHENIYPAKRCACLLLCANFYLGLRIGELACLKFDDFDFVKGVVRIYKTESKSYKRNDKGEKTGAMVYHVLEECKTVYSVREVPILPEVKHIYDLIKAHHKNAGYDSEYLCYDGTDNIRSKSLDRTLRRLCLLCEIEYFNSHAIRKTFITMMHFGGTPTRAISDIVGHSEIGTTENCYILSFDKNYEEYRKYMRSSLVYV